MEANPEDPVPTRSQLLACHLESILNLPLISDGIGQDLEAESRKLPNQSASPTYDADLIEKAAIATAVLGRNNSEPSAPESRILSAAIEHLDKELAFNERELLSLQLQVDKIVRETHGLREKGARLKEQQSVFGAPLSPVRRLPGEVLSNIFSHRADEEIVPPKKPSLLHIIQVCQSWRRAGLGDANLWNSLVIDVEDVFDWSLAVQRLPSLWFSRAKDLPLRFAIKGPDNDTIEPRSVALLESLTPFLSRLIELRVVASRVEHLAAFLCLSRDKLSSLKTLSVICKEGSIPLTLSIELFSSMPGLRTVALDLNSIQIWRSPYFMFPWNQITSLDIVQVLQSKAWYSIFCQCTNLEVGSFTIDSIGEPLTTNSQTLITFQSLTTLVIDLWSEDGSDIGNLQSLRFPALRDLSLVSGLFEVPVKNFLRTFPPENLQRLCLARLDLELNDVVAFLSRCNGLQELRIELPSYLDGAVFETLYTGIRGLDSVLLAPPPTLPNLISFAACICLEQDNYSRHDQLSEPPLTTLLRTWHERSAVAAKLQNVTLFLHGYDRGGDESDAEATHVSPIGRDYIANLRTDLHDCIYDEAACPAGFILETTLLNTRDVDRSTPLISRTVADGWHA
ncbi:hypothetical protein FPV67DRAFT_1778698 [Lyophyllum atratum]|nr:hypothetical protein FPV67DRAFT_1778698 [Lyophyllum atratum]